MNFFRKQLGREGEEEAAKFLVKRGYKILERNYRTRSGELDLIALHKECIVFIEVKTRTTDAYGAPEMAVNPRKQLRMIKTALGYLKYKQLHQMACRFDVVAISGAGHDMELIQDAFEMDRTNL